LIKKKWFHADRTGDRRIDAEFKQLKLPFGKRVDVLWFALFAAGFTVFIAGWVVTVLLGHRFGLFDPAPVQSIEDHRILVNVKDDIINHPILDAVFHKPENSLYIVRKGGAIHKYRPDTGLWATEFPFQQSPHPLPDPPQLVLLRSGCGSDPASNNAGTCLDNDSLWGLTVNGGLVRRKDGQWSVLKSDSTFIGSSGKPVPQEELTSAAVSDDLKWLAVGTKQEGIGMYHLTSQRWLTIAPELRQQLGDAEITHLAYSMGRFWIGGSKGVASLEIEPVGEELYVQQVNTMHSPVIDMDVDLKGRLWVLERRTCNTKGSNCIRLSRFNTADKIPEILIEETNIFPTLTLSDLHYAGYWPQEHRLLTAGTAGVFSYDTKRHSWDRHFRGAVQAVLPFRDKEKGFYFAYTGGFGMVTAQNPPWLSKDKKCTLWKLPGLNVNEKILSLRHGQDNEILGLGITGKVFALDPGLEKDNVQLVFSGNYTTIDPTTFHSAVSFGDGILLVGKDNALLHNFVQRTYKDLAITALPDWMKQPELTMTASGENVYASVNKRGGTYLYRVEKKDAMAGNFASGTQLAVIQGPVSRMRTWGDEGVTLIIGGLDGRVFQFTTGKQQLIGDGVPEMNQVTLLDAAPFGESVIFACNSGLRIYDYRFRSWDRNIPIYGNASPRELAALGDRLFTTTSDGRLMELNPQRKLEGRISSDWTFDMTDRQLSDIMLHNNNFYLAGNSRVNRYDTQMRSITDRWTLPGNNEIQMIDIVGGQPLTLSGGNAYIGTQALDPRAGPVLNISTDTDYIWAVLSKNNPGNPQSRYLKRYAISDPFSMSSRCYFYNPFSGPGTNEVHDVIELPDRNLAIAANNGLKFYNPTTRSWYGTVHNDPIAGGGRLYLMGTTLVTAARNRDEAQLSITDQNAVALPPGCGNDPVVFPVLTRPVRAYVIDNTRLQLAVIDKNGGVSQWHGQTELTLLKAPGPAPSPTTLKRVYRRNLENFNYLMFTTVDGRRLIRYQLDKRYWETIPLNGIPNNESVTDTDLEMVGYIERVLVRTQSGKYYLGSMEMLDPESTSVKSGITLKPLNTSPSGPSINGADIVDVQQRGRELWTIVLANEIRYYNPFNRRWSGSVSFQDLGDGARYYNWENRGIVVSSDEKKWYVSRDKGPHPTNFARCTLPSNSKAQALDDNGDIWHLQPDGTLFRLKLLKQGDYQKTADPLEQPFLLKADSVKAAYQWERCIIFDTDQGIRALDTVLRQEVNLPPGQGIEEVLKEDRNLWIRTGSGRVLQITRAQSRVGSQVHPAGTGDLKKDVEELRGIRFSQSPVLTDSWNTLAKNIAKLSNSQEAYDPVIDLTVNSSGQLTAKRKSGPELLAPLGITDFITPAPALDAGWLKWNRQTRSFEVKTNKGVQVVKAENFTTGGRFLFETVNALMPTSNNQLQAANRYGIWTYPGESLNLADRDITFRPVNWSTPTSAAHNHFISPDKIHQLDNTGTPTPSALAVHRVSFGDVVLSENLRNGGLSGQIKGLTNAFAQQGFTWDNNKRGLGYTAGQLLIHSDAGLHPFNSYTGFEKLPDNGSGNLDPSSGNTIYYHSGSAWYKRTGPSAWTRSATNPSLNRTLLDTPVWTWTLKNGSLEVKLKDKGHGFKPIWSAQGLGFSSDRLKDAAAFNNQVAVISDAFMEVTDPGAPNQISQYQAPRFPLPSVPITKLQSTRDNKGNNDLVLISGTGKSAWNNADNRFESIPSTGETLTLEYPSPNARLRFFRREDASGRRIVQKEFKVNDPVGRQYWVPFNFHKGRFPFDYVNSIAARKGTLYVGTSAGLQVYSGQLNTSLAAMTNCYQLRSSNRGALTPVTTVGTPPHRPDTLFAAAPGISIQSIDPANGGRSAETFQVSTTPEPLTRRRRYGTTDGFWQFINHNGKLDARYRDQKGNFNTSALTLVNGRFPHDWLLDVIVYQGNVFTLWRNGWVSRHLDGTMHLKLEGQIENYNFSASIPKRFIELRQDLQLGTVTAGRGLYLESEDGSIRRYSDASQQGGPGWRDENNLVVKNGLIAYADRPYILNRKNLRLLPPRKKDGRSLFSFQYRNIAGQWLPVAWDNGKLTLDRWTDFSYVNNSLWAATTAGLVRYARAADPAGGLDRIILEADNMMVIAEPTIKEKLPPVTDLIVTGTTMTLRCEGKSNQVFQGEVDGLRDQGVFNPRTDDPFTRQIMVTEQQTGWEWVLTGKTEYNPGQLEAVRQGEKVQLVGGRFSFDTINSIAFFKENQVEIGTDSGGWLQTVDDNLDVASLKQPKTPGVKAEDVKEVRAGLSPKGKRILGLRTRGRSFIRIDKEGISGETQQFPQFLGSDGFWQYSTTDSGLEITAAASTGSNGQVRRKLENGRFTDNIVLGLPVPWQTKEGSYYLLPTKAGILRLNQSLLPTDIYAKATVSGNKNPNTDDASGAEHSAPSVLYIDAKANQPLYLAQGMFFSFGTEASATGNVSLSRVYVPEGGTALAVEDGPQDFMRIRWEKNGVRGWTLMNPDGQRVEEDNSIYVNLSNFDQFISHRDQWGNVPPWMRVKLGVGELEFLLHQSQKPFRLPLPQTSRILAAFVNSTHLLLIGKTTMYRVNLEYAMQKALR